MTDRDKKLLEVVEKIPPTWTCIKCKRTFKNYPGDGQEIPWAFEVVTDAKTGRQSIGGNICQPCSNG